MNPHLRPLGLPLETQAAEGLPRRCWSVAEIEAMVRAGILDEDERFELIGGEVVPMSPKGNRHEVVKVALNLHWARMLPADIRFASETTFRLSADTYVEPDFVVYPKASGLAGLAAATALLVVEIADTSLGYDLGRKAALYAAFGVAELWVVDAVRLETCVHRDPAPNGYRSVAVVATDRRVVPTAVPTLAVVLSELDLDGAPRPSRRSAHSNCLATQMNPHLRPMGLPLETQAAEGLPRRCWSVAEIEEMVRAGIIDEDERFELIGGEVVPMSPKGARHEWVKIAVNRFLQRVAPDRLEIAPETTLRLDARSFVEPDFCVFPRGLALTALDGPAVLLAIEIADSSLSYDKGRKIGVYAAFGLREVWVIDAAKATTWIHRRLGAAGYAEIVEAPTAARLEPMLAPELAFSLAELGIEANTETRRAF